MKVIYTKIVGDLFHPGHVHFLRRARELGTRLVVHVVADDRVAAFKGRKPILNQEERAFVVGACRYVDQVTLEGPRIITEAFLDDRGYDLYAFAFSDEKELHQKQEDSPDLPPHRTAALSATPGISTTLLRRRVLESGR